MVGGRAFLADHNLKGQFVEIHGILQKLSSMIYVRTRVIISLFVIPLHQVCVSRAALSAHFYIKIVCLYFSPSPQVGDLAVVFVFFHNAWHLVNICSTWRDIWAMNLERCVEVRLQILINGRPKNSGWLFPIGNEKPLDLSCNKSKSSSTGE